jgi:hypothetical protein
MGRLDGYYFNCKNCKKEIDICFQLEEGEWIDEIASNGGVFYGYCSNCDLSHIWGVGKSCLFRASELMEEMKQAKPKSKQEILDFFRRVGYFISWPDGKLIPDPKYRRHKPKSQ